MEIFVVTFIVLAYFSWTHGYRDCRVRNFPVVEKFDVSRYLGRWYEQDTILSPDEPDDAKLRRLSTYVTAVTPTIQSTYGIGREPASGQCKEELLIFKLIDPPKGVFNVTLVTIPEPRTGTFFMVDTDYTGFLVFYRCYEERPDGTCNRQFLLTETRTPWKTPSDVRNIERVLDTLCIDRRRLLPVQVGQPCPKPQPQQCLARKKFFGGKY